MCSENRASRRTFWCTSGVPKAAQVSLVFVLVLSRGRERIFVCAFFFFSLALAVPKEDYCGPSYPQGPSHEARTYSQPENRTRHRLQCEARIVGRNYFDGCGGTPDARGDLRPPLVWSVMGEFGPRLHCRRDLSSI